MDVGKINLMECVYVLEVLHIYLMILCIYLTFWAFARGSDYFLEVLCIYPRFLAFTSNSDYYFPGVWFIYLKFCVFTWGSEYLPEVLCIYLRFWVFTWGSGVRKGFMRISVSSTDNSWSPNPRVTPMVASTRAYKVQGRQKLYNTDNQATLSIYLWFSKASLDMQGEESATVETPWKLYISYINRA